MANLNHIDIGIAYILGPITIVDYHTFKLEQVIKNN